MKKIPFHVLNYKLIDQMAKEQETKEGILFTSDEEWIIKYEKLGAIERLDRTPAPGILKITILEGPLKEDEASYDFEIMDDGITNNLILKESQVLSYRRFRERYLTTFQKLLPLMKNEEWGAVIAPLIGEAERITEDINDVPAVIDTLNKIENSDVVRNKKDLVAGGGNRVWLDTATDTLFVMSKDTLEPIAKKHEITLKRLSQLLADYMKRGSKRERIGSRLYYLWGFSPGRFEFRKKEDGDREGETGEEAREEKA